MLTLFRNPLLRLIASNWWVPALVVILASGLIGSGGVRHAAGFLGIGAVFLGAMLGAAGADVGLRALEARLRRRALGHRFLCPRCLRFSAAWVRCPSCRKRVSSFLLDGGGAYQERCPECEERFFPCFIVACAWCTHDTDLSRMSRAVRVVGVPLAQDFERLREIAGVPEADSRGLRSFEIDDGVRLCRVLNLADLPLPDRVVPAAHALHDIDALWLQGSDVEPLKLGQTLDCLLRQADLLARRRGGVPVFVGENDLEPVVRSLLATRLGAVIPAFPGEHFLASGRALEQEA